MRRSPFEVDISDLLGRDVPPRPVVVEAVVDWRLEMSRILPDPPLVAELSVASVPGGILVRGEVCCAVEHTCRSCSARWRGSPPNPNCSPPHCTIKAARAKPLAVR